MKRKTVFAGVSLLASSILNMLVRIGVFLDFVVSGLLVVGGVCVLAMKEWDSKGVFGLVCGLAGLAYTPIKLTTLYFILASILHLNRFWLLGLGLVFLIPTLGLCLASTLLLLSYRKSFFSSIRVEVLDPIEKRFWFL
ncbi:MAG: hypothetical protein DRO36_02770 [Candidatus Hecatellales archaeon]|nr:MAG: hypothetical protein DRO36_02770 [Candidatus Hecatellales archaeon]